MLHALPQLLNGTVRSSSASEAKLRCQEQRYCPARRRTAPCRRTRLMLAMLSSAVGQKAVDLPPTSTYAPFWSTLNTVPTT